MENIQLIFQTIFLFTVFSIILDKIGLIVNLVLNYLTSLPIQLVTKKEKLADAISSVISIITNILVFYCLVILLNNRIIQAVYFLNLNKTTYIILACVLVLYRAILQCRSSETSAESTLIDKYKTFCLYAYIPMFLILNYFNVNIASHPILWFVDVFYELYYMTIIGKIIAVIVFGTGLAVLIHIAIMFVSALIIIKKKTARY